MDRIEHKTFTSEIVRLDGKLFVNCSFEDCVLDFGGGLCEWEETRFANCRIRLDGAASDTALVLQALGFSINPPEMQLCKRSGDVSTA
jgi:hypothetical protein